MVKNKFPISCAFGNGAVVPLGQVIVKEDVHVGFEIGGVFAPRLVHRVQNPHRHAQAARGLYPFHALPREVHRVEDAPLAGARDMRKHPVFNRIMRGTVRWLVGDTPFQPPPMRQPLQVCLAQVLRGAVAAAAVTQHQYPLRQGVRRTTRVLPPQRHAVPPQGAGVVARVAVDVRGMVPHVIPPVGNQLPLTRGAESVVEGFHRLGGAGGAGTVTVPQSFLLFRVDRNHRIASRRILAPQARDGVAWRVAVRMVAHRLLLPRRAAAQFAFAQPPPDGAATGGRAQHQQPACSLAP